MRDPDLLAVLDEGDCWCGRSPEECGENGGCRWSKILVKVALSTERRVMRAEVASLEALADGTRARAEQTRQRAEHLRSVLAMAEVDDALREAGVVHPLGVAGVRDLGDLFAGQVQRAEEAEAVLTSAWLYEVLHVVWGFARGESNPWPPTVPTLTRAHAQSALSQVPDEVLVAAQITPGGGQ